VVVGQERGERIKEAFEGRVRPSPGAPRSLVVGSSKLRLQVSSQGFDERDEAQLVVDALGCRIDGVVRLMHNWALPTGFSVYSGALAHATAQTGVLLTVLRDVDYGAVWIANEEAP
jgi:hypothetical protein